MSNLNFAEEFGVGEEMQQDLPEQVERTEAAGVERTTYELKDGTQGSRAAFIREKFLEDNMSRKEISEAYGFEYRVVYSATVNMTNEAESGSRGRAVQNAVIQVTDDNALVVVTAEGQCFVNGEAVESAPETHDKPRNEWIQEQVKAGMERSEIAKLLDISYGVVYNLTKDETNTRTKHMVTLEDGTEISRNDYIRQRFADGVERGDIAKELDVPYSVVWQATKVEKTAAEKFADVVASLKAFEDQVEDAEGLKTIVEMLETVTFKAETTETPVE